MSREPVEIHTLRVVLVSPSDVTDERASVKETIEDLNLNLGRTFGVAFQLDVWENVHPGLHDGGPQGKIDSYLKTCDADVVIGIFSKKFGRPMSNGQTPTEHEIREAYRCWLQSHHPQLALYFNGEGVERPTLDDLDQLKAKESFRQEFLRKGIVSDYIGSADFANRVRNDLMNAMGAAIASLIAPNGVPCAISAEPKMLRGEGVTELVGEVRMSIPRRPDLGDVEADFHVFLNTNITNAVDPLYGALEPLLIVEQLPGDTSDYPVSTAQVIGANTLLFSSVKVPLNGPGGVRTLRLVGIRANAFQLMSAGTAPRVILTVVVESKSFPPITILNPTVTVGFSYHSFIVGSTVTTFRRADGINADFSSGRTSRPEISLYCTFSENFPTRSRIGFRRALGVHIRDQFQLPSRLSTARYSKSHLLMSPPEFGSMRVSPASIRTILQGCYSLHRRTMDRRPSV
jgi:hypothetical protein